MWFVYILLCEDGSLYTGCTNDLEKRFATHQNGKGGHYTRSHKPVKIVFQEKVATRSLALKREAQIKNLTRQQKKDLVELVV